MIRTRSELSCPFQFLNITAPVQTYTYNNINEHALQQLTSYRYSRAVKLAIVPEVTKTAASFLNNLADFFSSAGIKQYLKKSQINTFSNIKMDGTHHLNDSVLLLLTLKLETESSGHKNCIPIFLLVAEKYFSISTEIRS